MSTRRAPWLRLLAPSSAALAVWACAVDERVLPLAGSSSMPSAAGAPAGPDPDGGAGTEGGSAQGAAPNAGGAPAGAALCGDGRVDGEEACDDDAIASADGCSSNCELEPGYSCSGEPSACQSCRGEGDERRCRIAGGSFALGPQTEQVLAAVSVFELDELEVTVARFRRYVREFAGPPPAGAGSHRHLNNSGWRSEFDDSLPATRDALLESLRCNAGWATWSDEPGELERYPITCVSYYVAFGFCAWSGGRLPTEVEWEYTAAGGAQQRPYPWGDREPNATLALFSSLSLEPAGARPAGRARFGQLDLAGSVQEWVLDRYAPYPAACDPCAELESGSERVVRGGDWLVEGDALHSWQRFAFDPTLALGNVGFRCAYDVDELATP